VIHPIVSFARAALAASVALSACGDAGTTAADIALADVVADSAAPDTVAADAAAGDVDDAAYTADADATAPSWHVVLQGLPAALLSVSGGAAGEVWFTGADKGDGPWVVRGHAGTFTRVDLRAADPDGGHLWWSAAPDDSGRFLVGEGGRIFRWDAASEAVARVPTDTDATLYGVWGASADEAWAVGGYVHPRSGPPTVVRIHDGEGVAVVDLPAGLGAGTTLFKVWGAAADDVWVVGEAGTVLHWDGAAWSLDVLPGAPRLVTLHGGSADDMVVVGGSSQALILERAAGGAWTDASPGPYALLNGVYVAPGGDAIAAGVLGQTFARAGGVWTPSVDLPLTRDWHAAWIDARGDRWIVGGNLLSAATFDAGTALRYGPARDDLPAGPVTPLPVVHGDAEPDADVSAPADVVEAPHEVVDDTTPADTAPSDDAAPSEVIEDIGPTDTAPADTADTAAVEDPGLALGWLTGSTIFTPFAADEAIEIVQGPQGGIHVEIAVRLPWAGVATPTAAVTACDTAAKIQQGVSSCGQCPCTAITAIDARSFVGGVEVGSFVTAGYPVSLLSPGVYQTFSLPVIFDSDDAAPLVGSVDTLRVTITLPSGEQRSHEVTLTLRDDF
jgi:hypothetical protein